MANYAIRCQILRPGTAFGNSDREMLYGNFPRTFVWLDTIVVHKPSNVGGLDSTAVYVPNNPLLQACGNSNLAFSSLYSNPGTYKFPDYLSAKGVTPGAPGDYRELVYYLEVLD